MIYFECYRGQFWAHLAITFLIDRYKHKKDTRYDKSGFNIKKIFQEKLFLLIAVIVR